MSIIAPQLQPVEKRPSFKALGFKLFPVLRLPSEEVEARGVAIYQSRLRSELETSDDGRVVAIDVESEEYEVADTTVEAMCRLAARHPEAQVWIERIGCRAACVIR